MKPSHGASQLYFTDYTLAGQPNAFPSQESELRLGAPGQALCEALLCKALANFISPITLWLDSRMLSPPKSQSCDWGAWGKLLVKPSPARR